MKKPNTMERVANFVPKIDLKMKFTFFFLIVALFQINANTGYAQNTKISLELTQATLKEVFAEIENKTEFRFFYKNEDLNISKKMDLNMKKKRIEFILDRIFQGQNVAYEIYNKHIVLRKAPPKKASEETQVAAQLQISGTVSDSEGLSLPGASIVEKGTSNGTQTDFDGNFLLNVSNENAILVVSYIGYVAKEVSLEGQTSIVVTLQEDVAGLDEVIVVGYGTNTRKGLSSSVASVDAKDFNQGLVNQPTELLRGKVSGLVVNNRGGDPNAEPNVRIRGLTSTNNNGPLVVVDGVLGQSLNNVDPSDIENITILKDGSAAAIYGSRASNGVILVTTKSGNYNKPFSIQYNGQLTVEQVANRIDVMNREEFIAVGGKDLANNVNWMDEVTRDAVSNVHNIALSGGSENANYRVSMNFRDAKGILVNSGFKQYNVRTRLSGKLFNDKLNVNFNASLRQRDSKFGFNEALGYSVYHNPTSPIYAVDAPFEFSTTQFGGYFETLGVTNYFNPVAITNQSKNYGALDVVNYNVDLKYSITDSLSAQVILGKQNASNQTRQYYPTTAFFRGGAESSASKGRANFFSSQSENTTLEAFGTWDKVLSDRFTMKFTGGYSWQEFDSNSYSLGLGDFPPGVDFDFSNQIEVSQALQDAGRVTASSGRNDDVRVIAFFGRMNFVIDDAIFIDGTLRREGSTRFGEGNKWGLFPATGVAVDVNKYLNLNKVDLLKVRFGYGVTGSIPNFDGASQTIYNILPSSDGFDAFSTAEIGNDKPNPDLGWEEKRETNLGLDFQRGGLSLSLDVYDRDVVDLIQGIAIPPADNDGFDSQIQNVGSLKTKGLEFMANYGVINKEKLTYNTGVVFSTYKTEVVKYLDGDPRLTGHLGAPGIQTSTIKIREGDQVGEIYGPVFSGEVDDNGTPLFVDTNGDGEVNASREDAFEDNSDHQVLGKGLPDYEIGWTNQLTFGNWDVNAFFRAAVGHSLVNAFRAFYEPRVGSNTAFNFVNTKYARDDIRSSSFNSYYVEKADYFKLDNLTIGYNFNLNSDYIKSMRLALSGQNLFTITGYSGADPEVALVDGGNVLAPGIDRRNSYFASRSLTLGLNINF